MFSEKQKDISKEEEKGVLERRKVLNVLLKTQMGKQNNLLSNTTTDICSATMYMSFYISICTSVKKSFILIP